MTRNCSRGRETTDTAQPTKKRSIFKNKKVTISDRVQRATRSSVLKQRLQLSVTNDSVDTGAITSFANKNGEENNTPIQPIDSFDSDDGFTFDEPQLENITEESVRTDNENTSQKQQESKTNAEVFADTEIREPQQPAKAKEALAVTISDRVQRATRSSVSKKCLQLSATNDSVDTGAFTNSAHKNVQKSNAPVQPMNAVDPEEGKLKNKGKNILSLTCSLDVNKKNFQFFDIPHILPNIRH